MPPIGSEGLSESKARREAYLSFAFFAAPVFTAQRLALKGARDLLAEEREPPPSPCDRPPAAVAVLTTAEPPREPRPKGPKPGERGREPRSPRSPGPREIERPHPWSGTPPPPMPDGTPWP